MKNNKITAYEIEWDIYEGYLEGLDDDQIRTQYPNEVEIDIGHITTDDPDEIGDMIEQFLEDDYVCVKSFLYDLN